MINCSTGKMNDEMQRQKQTPKRNRYLKKNDLDCLAKERRVIKIRSLGKLPVAMSSSARTVDHASLFDCARL